ncbi:MAG: T9SS type A sorting domain-containing protein [Bacteroidota bacterium]
MKIKKLHFTMLAFTTFNLQLLTYNSQAQVNFAQPVSFAVGGNPKSVISADFNNDGKVDLASVNSNDNNLSVLLGDGIGGFGAATNFVVGNTPYSITSGDFNTDGKADLAVVNSISNDVSILLGDGLGSFSTATTFAVGSSPYSIISSDFNGDSKADLAIANNGSNNISILLGDGTGGFGAATDFTIVGSPFSVISADFNGDGKADLATANYFSNNVSILLGNGLGSFGSATNFTVSSHPYAVIGADFNGDGKVDLATANNNPSFNNVTILIGNGLGSFVASNFVSGGTQPSSVVSADFNNDTKADLAVVNQTSFNISIFLGDGGGSFSPATNFAEGSYPFSVISGDFNSDGKVDLAVANPSDNSLSILLNNSAPPIPPICLVTVDSTHTHNLLVWEKANLNMAAIDSFIVYREITTNNYQRIGFVLRDSLSTFDDFAANPATTGYRYKLKSKNTQGVASLFSDYHNTIYLTNTGANFSWTPYQVENNTTPVSSYNIYRDDNSTGNFLAIGNTTGNQIGYTDVNFASYPNASYYVEAVIAAGTCHPTRSGFNASRSNVKHFGTTGIQPLDISSINIYPNPTNNALNITGVTEKTTIRVYDLVGKLVIEKAVENNTTINTSALTEGVYTLLAENKTGKTINKVVINR